MEEAKPDDTQMMTSTKQMPFQERWQRTLSLWPYIVPLIVVYFAEYSMQVHSDSLAVQQVQFVACSSKACNIEGWKL